MTGAAGPVRYSRLCQTRQARFMVQVATNGHFRDARGRGFGDEVYRRVLRPAVLTNTLVASRFHSSEELNKLPAPYRANITFRHSHVPSLFR